MNEQQKGSLGQEDGRIAKTFLKAREQLEIEKNKAITVPSSPMNRKFRKTSLGKLKIEHEIEYNGNPREYTKSVLQ